MTAYEQSQAMIDVLNSAAFADAGAIHALIANRVPCNAALANDHPFVQCGDSRVAGIDEVGALWLINGMLAAAGIPLICAVFDDEKQPPRFIGFNTYKDCSNG